MRKNKIIFLTAGAIFIKSFLFLYAESNVPELKIRNDTHWYLESGLTLVSEGIFGKINNDGSVTYQYYRTPGYPLFLGVLHGWLKIPLSGIILFQILLTVLSAIIVFRTAHTIDPKLGQISFLIILLDPAITVYSLMLLSETLFLLLMCIFMFKMVAYIQKNKTKHLVQSALALAAATYVRPISLYLGGIMALLIFFMTFHKNFKKGIVHACIFTITVSSLLFVWQWRNHHHFGEYRFSKVEHSATQYYGLYKSYSRNTDPLTQGLAPVPYYINVTSRCLLSLFTRPVSLKYFESDLLKKVGKIFSYIWITFWMTGFIGGLSKMAQNKYFYFFLIVIVYFSAVSIIGVMWFADARFCVPMMPFIAILSSYGWNHLMKKETDQLHLSP